MGAIARAYNAVKEARDRVNRVHNRIIYAHRKEDVVDEKALEEILEAHTYLKVASDVFYTGGWIYDKLIKASDMVYNIWMELALSIRRGFPPPYPLISTAKEVMRILTEVENALYPEFKEQMVEEARRRK